MFLDIFGTGDRFTYSDLPNKLFSDSDRYLYYDIYNIITIINTKVGCGYRLSHIRLKLIERRKTGTKILFYLSSFEEPRRGLSTLNTSPSFPFSPLLPSRSRSTSY